MMAITIYILGCIICYITIKYLRDQVFTNNWIWVIFGLIYSVGSWFSLFLLMFIVGLIYVLTLLILNHPNGYKI